MDIAALLFRILCFLVIFNHMPQSDLLCDIFKYLDGMVMHILLLLIILFTVLIQGGFFPTIILISGAMLSIACIFQRKKFISTCEILSFAYAALYIISSLINGYNSASLSQAGLPLSCTVFLLLYQSLSQEKKERLILDIVMCSGVLAVLACMSFCGIIDITGAVTANRLQFTFQYANTAGAWFAAIILLGQDMDNIKCKYSIIPCITALLLTRSVGALGMYAVIQIARLVMRRNEKNLWQELLTIHVLSGLFAVLLFLLHGWHSIPILLLMIASAIFSHSILNISKKLYFHWFCLAGGIAGSVMFVLSQRVSGSILTFMERISQIVDGCKLIIMHPLFGIGAGNWAYVYPYYQSAQYTSTVIHSSVVQTGVDAGIFAILVEVVFIGVALHKHIRPQSDTLAAIMILGHSLLDFTLQFFPICALLIVTLFNGIESDRNLKGSICKCIPAFALLCCIFTGTMLYSELKVKSIVRDAQTGNWNSILTNYDNNRVVYGENQTVHNHLVYALYYTGRFDDVISLTYPGQLSDTSSLLLRAEALRYKGDEDGACDLLLTELREQRYRVILYEEISKLFLSWNVSETYLDMYDNLVDEANASQTQLGRLQGDQVIIDHIKRGGTV